MRHPNALYFQRRAEADARRLAAVGAFVAASLVGVRHQCGQPRCRCAAGVGHASWRLTYKGPGQKTRTVYVPVGLLAEVRQWVRNYRRCKRLAAAISQAQIARVRLYVAERRRRGPAPDSPRSSNG
jgi:hypothetical protein